MTKRKSRNAAAAIKGARRKAVAAPAVLEQTTPIDVATDPTLPLQLEMTGWQTAFNALVLLPMAVAMFIGAAPLVVANAFSYKPAAGVTI